ncbi:hypothetical protein FB567DRAFT_549986 [Paraphoma chrysanthemicola]|uniref:Uncharacterized protein n=1 Tax=Paraphoma chrysanthemicola TaxID=798071 RepID=A0A8K0VXB9_9PLEO|nr:hypothetical protein FB567DRAFT_549986 [Paraphoma chrysanthemicola]
MSTARGIYTKSDLETILRKRCPAALSKFPNPETFHIHLDTRGDGHPELRIGSSISKDSRGNARKVFLWVKEPTDDAPSLLYFTREHGVARPATSTKKYHFTGEGIFGKVYKDGLAHGGIAMHALFKYVMLVCGYKPVFKDRLDFPKTIAEQEEGDVRGLVIALKQIAKRSARGVRLETKAVKDGGERDIESANNLGGDDVAEDDAKAVDIAGSEKAGAGVGGDVETTLNDCGTRKRAREVDGVEDEDAKLAKRLCAGY